MAKRKQKTNPLVIIVGIALLLIYAKQSGFLGALITVCEPTEPASYNDFLLYVDSQPTWATAPDPTGDLEGYLGTEFNRKVFYDGGTEFFTAGVGDLAGASCSQQLTNLADAQNVSLSIVSGRLYLSGGYGAIFCSRSDQFIITLEGSSADITAWDNYFQNCSQIEDPLQGDDNETVVNETQDNETQSDSSDNDDLGRQADNETVVVQPTTTTPPPTVSEPEGIIEQIQDYFDRMSNTRKSLAGVGVVLVIFLLYWNFEKGPNKGLVKGRRKK